MCLKTRKLDIYFVDKIFLDKIIKKEKPVHNNLVFTKIIVIVKKYLSVKSDYSFEGIFFNYLNKFNKLKTMKQKAKEESICVYYIFNLYLLYVDYYVIISYKSIVMNTMNYQMRKKEESKEESIDQEES